MFERLSGRGSAVISWSGNEGRTLQQPYLGTEHLLLGLLREEDHRSDSLHVLLRCGVDVDALLERARSVA